MDLPGQDYDLDEIIQRFPLVKQAESDLRGGSKKTSSAYWAKNANLIVSRHIIQPDPRYPILLKTRPGWTLHGNTQSLWCEVVEQIFLCCEQTDEILETVKTYMKIENLGISLRKIDKKQFLEEKKAISIPENSICFQNRQYEVRLPW